MHSSTDSDEENLHLIWLTRQPYCCLTAILGCVLYCKHVIWPIILQFPTGDYVCCSPFNLVICKRVRFSMKKWHWESLWWTACCSWRDTSHPWPERFDSTYPTCVQVTWVERNNGCSFLVSWDVHHIPNCLSSFTISPPAHSIRFSTWYAGYCHLDEAEHMT